MPRRIVKEPWTERVMHNGVETTTRFYLCDNGKTYTTQQLSDICGLNSQGVYQRCYKYGWQDPRVLQRGYIYQSKVRNVKRRPANCAAPRKIVSKRRGSGTTCIYLCDDGKEYLSKELALKVGLTSHVSISTRIQRYGLHDPRVLGDFDSAEAEDDMVPTDEWLAMGD